MWLTSNFNNFIATFLFVPSCMHLELHMIDNNNFHVFCLFQVEIRFFGVGLQVRRPWVQQHWPVSFDRGELTGTMHSTGYSHGHCAPSGIEPGRRESYHWATRAFVPTQFHSEIWNICFYLVPPVWLVDFMMNCMAMSRSVLVNLTRGRSI